MGTRDTTHYATTGKNSTTTCISLAIVYMCNVDVKTDLLVGVVSVRVCPGAVVRGFILFLISFHLLVKGIHFNEDSGHIEPLKCDVLQVTKPVSLFSIHS